jgi:CBS domain-containing protein
MEPLECILSEKEGNGRTLQVIAPEATVLSAVEAMCRAHVGALLVMRGSVLVGIFSERDLMTRVVLARLDPAAVPVGDVMTRDVVSIAPDVAPEHAMALITNQRIRHLPVVDGARVVGIVSIGDLVRWTVRDREHSIEQLQEYVTGRYPG